MTEVIPRLWIGNWRDAEANLGKMYVITVAHDSVVTGNIKFDLIDGPGNSIELLSNAINHTVDAYNCGKNVLVHCHGGRSRSGTVITAALTKITNRNLCESYDLLIERHRETRIHPYLSIMLLELLK